jgi:hypothetical protein
MAIMHHASYLVNGIETYGTAELVCGSGYLFRQDGERQALLVSYKDPHLVINGLCAVADAQSLDDEIHGGAAMICTTRAMETR